MSESSEFFNIEFIAQPSDYCRAVVSMNASHIVFPYDNLSDNEAKKHFIDKLILDLEKLRDA